jgi:WD40 repeat protein
LIVFDGKGHVRAYRSGRAVAPRLDLPPGFVPNSAGITPDGRHLLVASYDVGTETVDLVTGRKVAGPNPAMVEVAVSSRGLAAGAGPDGRVAFYDPRTLRPRGAALPGALGGAYDLRFSADGNRLLIQSGDRTLRLVDVPSRTVMGDPIPVGETVNLFSHERHLLRADGREVAAQLDDGIAIWDLDPANWIGAACKAAGRNLTREEWTRYLGAFGAYHQTCPAYRRTG